MAYRPNVYRTGVWIRVKWKFLAHSALPPTHTHKAAYFDGAWRAVTKLDWEEARKNWETSCRSETTQSAFGQLGVKFYHLGCQENVIHCTWDFKLCKLTGLVHNINYEKSTKVKLKKRQCSSHNKEKKNMMPSRQLPFLCQNKWWPLIVTSLFALLLG